MLAAEQRQLLNQLTNTSDIKFRRLLQISQQLGQTSLTLSLTKLEKRDKPAATRDGQRPIVIHELVAQ